MKLPDYESEAPLFANVRREDPATSRDAALRLREFAKGHCIKILEALKSGPMGKTRIAGITGLDGVAVARRLSDLQKAGLAVPTDMVEISDSGRKERIWLRCDKECWK